MSWVFFPENHDKTDEVCAEITGSLKLVISLFISVGKIQHLFSNEGWCVCMKVHVGSFLYWSTWSEWLLLVYRK